MNIMRWRQVRWACLRVVGVNGEICLIGDQKLLKSDICKEVCILYLIKIILSKKISKDQIPHPALKSKREITKYIK